MLLHLQGYTHAVAVQAIVVLSSQLVHIYLQAAEILRLIKHP